MVVSGLMPFQRGKSSNPLSLFGEKIGSWMDKVLPPILPAPAALPARTTIGVNLAFPSIDTVEMSSDNRSN
jgi:hypothetical protein